jgi:hypothetical protein
LITDTESSSWITPFDGLLVARDPTASAFETSFIGKGDMILPQGITFSWTCIKAGFQITGVTELFVHNDMNVPVDLEFV